MDPPLRLIETVGINGLTLCLQWLGAPDAAGCAQGAHLPVPFVNTAFAKGAATVFAHGGAMNGIKGPEFHKSIGGGPGVGGKPVYCARLRRMIPS